MLIIGHRGAKGLAPENTIRSLKKAESLGVDMVEMDLRLRYDQQIVTVHDPDRKKIFAGAPKLLDVLQSTKLPLDLEIKHAGFEKQLLQLIKKFPSEILISSGKPNVLAKIRILDRKIKLGLILSPKYKNLFNLSFPLLRALKLNSLIVFHTLLNEKSIKRMRKLKVKIYSWTVNDLVELNRLKSLGVDGVITDRPDLIKKYD